MAWYHLRPKVTKDINELTETYNEKYGNYDYAEDSRSLDGSFNEILLKSVEDISGMSVLVCGANAGYEIDILSKLFPTAKFTAVDISTDALDRIPGAVPEVTTIHASMEHLPFEDKAFDLYLNCRAIHSSDVDMRKAVSEAVRVTKGRIVVSISNGYKVGESIVNGMYDYDLRDIDSKKPANIAKQIKVMFVETGYAADETLSEAEIFLVFAPLAM